MKDLIKQILRENIFLTEQKKWNYDALKDEAQKYATRLEFAKNSKSAYNAAKRIGVFDEITAHMPKPKEWTQDELELEAKKYNTITDFQNKSKGAYLKAYRLGILKDITKHMTTNKAETLNTDKFIDRAKQIHGDKYDYSLVDYCNTRTPITIICRKHNKKFQQLAGSHLYGQGCPLCRYEISSSKTRTPLPDFIDAANQIHNNKYKYDKSVYNNNNTNLIVTCPEHGDFLVTPANHIHNQSGCPYCQESKGEKLIANILDNLNVSYIRQMKYEDCTNQKIGKGCRKLPFDFYLPQYNSVIEYDGEQHFREIKAWGGEEKFINRQKLDKLKDEFCKKNNIKMVRIPYIMKQPEIVNLLQGEFNITS